MGEREESADDGSSWQNAYVSDHFFLFLFIVCFSSDGDRTVRVKIEESTDDGSCRQSTDYGSSWHNVSDHFLCAPLLSNPFLSEGNLS